MVSLDVDVMSVDLDWVVWFVAAAVGGFAGLMSAVVIDRAYGGRHRRRSPSGRSDAAPAMPTVPSPPDELTHEASTPPPEDITATASPATAGRGDDGGSSRLPSGTALIGYVTTAGGAGVDDERESATVIETTCDRSGWRLVEIVCDRDEGAALDRPALHYALERIAAGHADGLVVSDLQRVSRSIVDLGALLAWFRDAGATLIALDLNIDTSTPEGCHVADTLIALSARDHERIASGTRRGLARARASGGPTGRPAVSQRPELVERIAAMRANNMTLRAIADQLNAEGVPTLRGGKKWRPSSIQAALGYRRPRAREHLPPPRAQAGP